LFFVVAFALFEKTADETTNNITPNHTLVSLIVFTS